MRDPAREAAIEERAYGVLIAERVGGLPERLLGRHIRRRSNDQVGPRVVLLELRPVHRDLRYAEVENLRLLAFQG